MLGRFLFTLSVFTLVCASGCTNAPLPPHADVSAVAEAPNDTTPQAAELRFESSMPDPNCLQDCDYVGVPADVRVTRNGEQVLVRHGESAWTEAFADPLAGELEIDADLGEHGTRSGVLGFPAAFTIQLTPQPGGEVDVVWTNPGAERRVVIEVANASNRIEAHSGEDDGQETIVSGMSFDRVIVTKQRPIAGEATLGGIASLGVSAQLPVP